MKQQAPLVYPSLCFNWTSLILSIQKCDVTQCEEKMRYESKKHEICRVKLIRIDILLYVTMLLEII